MGLLGLKVQLYTINFKRIESTMKTKRFMVNDIKDKLCIIQY